MKHTIGLIMCFVGGGIVGSVTRRVWVGVIGIAIAQIGYGLLAT